MKIFKIGPPFSNLYFPSNFLVMSLTSLFFFGCTSLDKHAPNLPVHHILMFNRDGNPVDPTGTERLCSNQPIGKPGKEVVLCRGKHAIVWPATVFSDYKKLEYYGMDVDSPYKRYLDHVFEKMRDHFDINTKGKLSKAKNGEPHKIMFFIHGGLNTQEETLERVVSGEGLDHPLFEEIKEAGYYPIFINWHSWLWSTYFEHVFRVRQGENWEFFGPISSPVVFVVDVARSLSRAAMVWASMTYNEYKGKGYFPFYYFDDKSPVLVASKVLGYENYEKADCLRFGGGDKANEFPITIGGPFEFNSQNEKYAFQVRSLRMGCEPNVWGLKKGLKGIRLAVTIPLRLLTAPFLDAFGTSAWNNMYRRVKLLFQIDDEFHANENGSNVSWANRNYELPRVPESGGLAIFLRHFAREIQTHGVENFEITLVGHSMGTIVLNEMVKTFSKINVCSGPCKETDLKRVKMPYKNIVYLAGAAPVREFEGSILPYLQDNNDSKNGPNFYNLMLHRKAEVKEVNAWDFTPRGSLLVWIDDFLSSPLTHTDRTLGRFDNFFISLHKIPDNIRDQIHITTFREESVISSGRESFSDPQNHGDFTSSFKFWLEKCWGGGKNYSDQYCKRKN